MIHLDNAATSYPKPEAVYARVDDILRRVAGNPGRASHRMAVEASRVIFSARESVARLINAPDSSRVAFTKNATEAINIALKGLLKPGDHLVTTSFEHNSVVKAASRLERSGVEVTRVEPGPTGILDPADIEAAIRDNTRIVCITHASNVLGAIQPVDRVAGVCRDHGVLSMVDGAQTLGAYPVDVAGLGVDILAATGHKALFGPQGTGFLYVADGIEPEPLIDGGTGEVDTVLEMPERLEAGTMNTPGVGGLGAGVEFVLSEGVENIRAHELGLVTALLEGLASIKGVTVSGPPKAEDRVALVSFTVEGVAPAEAGARLDEDYGILVRTGTHCAPDAHRTAGTFPEGTIRVSPGYFTTLEEIGVVLGAVEAIAG